MHEHIMLGLPIILSSMQFFFILPIILHFFSFLFLFILPLGQQSSCLQLIHTQLHCIIALLYCAKTKSCYILLALFSTLLKLLYVIVL